MYHVCRCIFILPHNIFILPNNCCISTPLLSQEHSAHACASQGGVVNSVQFKTVVTIPSRTTDVKHRSHKVMAGHHDEHPGNHYNMGSCHCNTQYHHYCHWHSPLTSFTQINSGPTVFCIVRATATYRITTLRMRVPRAT